MENTEREESVEVFDHAQDVQQPELNEKKEKKRKRSRSKKSGRGIRAVLRVVQHIVLAAMVFSMIVVTVGTTVQVKTVNHAWGGTVSYTGYPDPGTPFEDSGVFNQIFGHAAADIIRFGVVSSQLETDGVFDGDKLVDVTAYNYRDSVLPERYVTAVYRLEDLIKWQNYGFTWNSSTMNSKEAADFLAAATQVTSIDPKSGYRNTSDAGYLKSDVKSYTSVKDVSSSSDIPAGGYTDNSGFVEGYQPIGALSDHAEAVIVYNEETGEYAAETETYAAQEEKEAAVNSDETEIADYDILVNRYKTVDGKNLEDYVSDWDLYYDLCHSVMQAAESLAYNYDEYVAYADYYSMENSNVRYLIEKQVGEETQYYSNMPAGSSDREKAIAKMRDYETQEKTAAPFAGRYIYYSPADMVYTTNTSIEEDTVGKILKNYDYAYPENVKIWIGVDTSYPVQDAFTQGKEYLPNLWLWVAAAIIFGLLYAFLFGYQTVTTGREYDETGEKQTRLNTFDRIPTEAALAIAFIAALLACWILVMVTEIVGCDPTDIEFWRETIHNDWYQAAVIALVFAADALFTFFFYSLVRRMKARTLIKNSYVYRILLRLKEFAWKVYDNGGIVLRTWVPYCIFMAFNLFMVLLTFETWNILLLLFAGAIDIIVGILLYKDTKERQGIVEGIETIAAGEVEHQINTEELHGDNKVLANSVNSIGKGIKEAVEISMKDERMKADLITNVSHDIKTPLTSIINYVDLLKRERVDNEKVQNYIRVLDEKSQRLKQLTDDLVEASKITSGNISYHFERINLTELLNQTIGEFSEKFETKNLTTVMNVNVQNAVIEADSRRIWRVMENLFNNVFKYAMPGTRVYVAIDKPERGQEEPAQIEISIKNISENPLNCRPEELTERFIRGDESRTTEGSGLGLSIAKNLTVAQRGSFEIELDGDLFKVFLIFPAAGETT